MDNTDITLAKYMLTESKKKNNEINFIALSSNPMISVSELLEIIENSGEKHQQIMHNPNLTLDDVEQIKVCYYALATIGQYYDLLSDTRIIFNNGRFYYKSHEISWKFIRMNKHITYEFYKLYCKDMISNNEYILYNPNGDCRNFDFSDSTIDIVYCINNFKGIYNDKLDEFIIEHKSKLRHKIDHAMSYLRYEFIIENEDIFYNIHNSCYLYINNTLTIDNVLHMIDKLNIFQRSLFEDSAIMAHIFMNANITLEDIITNNLHNHKYFYLFASNRNCTVSDILNNPDLNFKDIADCLSSNKHDYTINLNQFKFAFID